MRLYWIYFIISLSTLFFALIGFILTPLDWKGKIWAFIVRTWAKSILWAANLRYSLKGLDNLETGQQYVFACNHESIIDIPLTLAGIPRPVVPIAKIEIKKIPLLSWAMLAAGHIFVDRSDHKKALESMEKARKSLVRKPRSILIFPEGTRSLDGNIQPFKKGGIIFAINSGLPIVPMACCGTFDVLVNGSKNFNPKPLELRFAQPIKTKQDDMDQRNRITEQVQNEVERLKNEWATTDQKNVV